MEPEKSEHQEKKILFVVSIDTKAMVIPRVYL